METNPFRAYPEWSPPTSPPGGAAPEPRTGAPEAPPEGVLAGARGWVESRAAGRNAWVRAPLLLVLGWMFWRYLGDRYHASIFGGINLAFHEIGHVLFSFFGSELLVYAGGTLLELAIPLIAAAMLARQGDAFGVCVGGFWFGTALHGVSVYVADTRTQQFGRVSIGDYDGPDDWTYLLERFDLIRQDVLIGGWFRFAALLAMAAALIYGLWVLWLMAARPGSGVAEDARLGEEGARLAAFLADGRRGPRSGGAPPGGTPRRKGASGGAPGSRGDRGP